ncbi:MAG: NGG1p interacting factor NIF3 [Candidatus Omnitrophica bacterium]|jgi:putative NIF3 family GTP cyclohydrolase 1 type 2|nr:NGG1p interacting factor NIF3 [Candidatus Omnitrophota bacterium]MDD5252444.1 NGG1p interacting factor NIF3 [Candidatus Omnitrophota bacterium]
MKLIDFFNQAIRFGRLADPRADKKKIASFPDSGILFGRPNTEVKKIMVGIDIEVAELLLAEHIRQKEGLDLVVAHHPEGKSYVGLHEVMRLQVDLLRQAGVAYKTAVRLVDERMLEVERRVLPQNHTRPIDAARLLDLPFINLHTPADNHVYKFLKVLFDRKRSVLHSVGDIVKLLKDIPEYQIAEKFNTGPRIILGNLKRPTGKILLEMTGGTEGSKDVFNKLYKAGVRTLVSMHLSEEHLKKAREANLNVVIAGHISSDTLGLNLLLDNIEKAARQKFQVISCSGFTRIRRGQ